MAQIRSDEEVLFFPVPAALSDDGSVWTAEVHAWIYEPETGDLLRRWLLTQMCDQLGIADSDERALFRRRAQWFLVDNERGKTLRVRCCGREFPLGLSARDGHCYGTIRVPRAAAESAASEGRLEFEVVVPAREARQFRGVMHLVPPTGFSVISDIDDTVKVTHAHDVSRAVRQTLTQEFVAVPGMAELYRRWADQGALFHFASASPWQLYPLLKEFLELEEFPAATFHMQSVRLKDASALNLLRPALESKPALIQPLLAAYPGRRFVLVGDCGQQDPEIYGALARQFAGRVVRVFVRAIPGLADDPQRWRSAFADVPSEQWQIFSDPQQLPDLDCLPT